MPKTIKLKNIFGRSIHLRASVDLLKEKIYKLKIEARDLKDINLDFEGIEFVSRSAAHEILKLKSEIEKDGIFLSFSNQNEFVRRMFEIVAKQIRPEYKRHQRKSGIKVIKIKDINKLEELFNEMK